MVKEIAIKVRRLSHIASGRVVLKSVSLSIARAEIFGLLGPNGAGKTTLLKILSGAIRPQEGDVYFYFSKSPTHRSWKSRIGLAPQHHAFFQEFTVEQNLRFFGTLYNLSGRGLERRIKELTRWLHLEHFMKTRAEYLSGGYQRLLNLACTLLHDPEIIFLDEPTVGLDPYVRNIFWEKIATLKKQGKTVVMTTHYMNEAQDLCDRIAILDKGKILIEGTPMQLIRKYGGARIMIVKLNATVSSELVFALKSSLEETDIKALGPYIIVSFHKPRSIDDVSRAVSLIHAHGFTIDHATIREPQLEDVFLHLTGKWMG